MREHHHGAGMANDFARDFYAAGFNHPVYFHRNDVALVNRLAADGAMGQSGYPFCEGGNIRASSIGREWNILVLILFRRLPGSAMRATRLCALQSGKANFSIRVLAALESSEAFSALRSPSILSLSLP